MGVASGGLAIKRKGTFGVKPIPINKEQFSLRDQALQSRETYEHTGNEDYNKEGNDVFWKAEFMLREIFDIQEGDEASLKTILHYPFRDAIRKTPGKLPLPSGTPAGTLRYPPGISLSFR